MGWLLRPEMRNMGRCGLSRTCQTWKQQVSVLELGNGEILYTEHLLKPNPHAGPWVREGPGSLHCAHRGSEIGEGRTDIRGPQDTVFRGRSPFRIRIRLAGLACALLPRSGGITAIEQATGTVPREQGHRYGAPARCMQRLEQAWGSASPGGTGTALSKITASSRP